VADCGSGVVGGCGVTGRPSGTVTFLFTDIEVSTRRWEADPEGMREALAAHDDVLRAAVDANGGWLFKHTGDGVCAAFQSARAAVDAAIDAQRSLELPVRMGIVTGEPEQRGDDYFGPALNRAARVMAVGHGGQILLSSSTAGLVTGVDLVDLGEHRLRDLSGVEHLFQVCADGLLSEFPRLRTVDAVPGNLPAQATSFVGRDVEVKELAELVHVHRLVTLTGVGGVGKTRLAVQVAAELVPDFPDGVWLVELAPVGDPSAVPDAVATALGITPQPGRTATASIAETLAERRVLVVFDNCEHVLDAAADLIEAVVGRSTTVSVIATSREGLRVGAEHLWPVPSLDVGDGAGSAAVALFIERARALVPGFNLDDDDADAVAVTEICRRLDGIALAIELAAARMVSMTPVDVLGRLNDRFRLLSGSPRGLERHQTLRQAVQWSYDLLTSEEQAVLASCAVFAGGFDVVSVTAVCEELDEYEMLDVLDSLVRKSLVTATRTAGHARYGMLETIRQFTEDQHATTGRLAVLRDRHARHYAGQVVARWEIYDGPGYDDATDWVEVEFDNLRAGFRWASDQADLTTATAIAAHTTMIAVPLQQFEPIGWAEELLPAAGAANVTQLPRLYLAASYCLYTGRAEHAVGYAEAAVRLQSDPGYQPPADGWAACQEANAQLYAGRVDRFVDICTGLAAQTGLARVGGLFGLTAVLPMVGRSGEAMVLADDAMAAARAHANPFWIAAAYYACGRAYTSTDPHRALDTYREGVAYTRQHRIPMWDAFIARDAAGLEATHGDIDQALDLFDEGISSFHRAGDTISLTYIFGHLMAFFDRVGQPEIAATVYGTFTNNPLANQAIEFAATVDHVRDVLDTDTFDACVHTGAAKTTTEAVHYTQHHIQLTRQHQPRHPP
jgi:predicted ATPase/class 3 adenylate cyclase